MSGVPARGARQRALGQNFLIDKNMLDVIERLAGVQEDDVVLEVGGGAGVLTERLVQSARYLHLVELDRRLEDGLRAVLSGHEGRSSLWLGDALDLDLAALRPPPARMVANLPYGIAATLVIRTVQELPTLCHWVVMVQREVGERLAASPGTAAYGVPSVLAGLSCDVRVLRRVARTVFRPVPNVDSVLLGMTRTGPPAEESVRSLVHDAFAHRRKALTRSVQLARHLDPGGRDQVRAALAGLGLPEDVRAERLSPVQFVALADALA